MGPDFETKKTILDKVAGLGTEEQKETRVS